MNEDEIISFLGQVERSELTVEKRYGYKGGPA
jgi:hypothetical protein